MDAGNKYLLDTSALYPLLLRLREKLLVYSNLFTVLDLTMYEVGNVIWKEYRKGRIREPLIIAQLFQEILEDIETITLQGCLKDVIKLAVEENLTFYDVAYLYIARRRGMKLVTEDNDLLRFPETISTGKLLEELEKL